MLSEGAARKKTASFLRPTGRIGKGSFQDWFRGSKVVGADGAPLPVYHASPTTADLQPKSYGTVGERLTSLMLPSTKGKSSRPRTADIVHTQEALTTRKFCAASVTVRT